MDEKIKDGLHTEWYENGQKKEETTYKDGEKDGLWTEWFENGQKEKEGTYKNGKEDGKYTLWYSNGQKEEEGTFKNGKEDGKYTFWYENGRKKDKGTWKNGAKSGDNIQYWLNGQKYKKRTFVIFPGKIGRRKMEGLLDGLMTMWYENGQIMRELHYKKNQWNGRETSWYDNGQKKYEGHHIKNKKEGEWLEWNKDGSIKSKTFYKKGEIDTHGVDKKWNKLLKQKKWLNKMILLCNGDSWTQGDGNDSSCSQTPNWEATKTLDWYDIIPNFGDNKAKSRKILYKFYDSQVWPKVLGEKLGVETWNAGRLGTSNDNIFRTTINSIDYLETLGKKDIFVVIAFTSLVRYEIFQPYAEKKSHPDVPHAIPSIYECHWDSEIPTQRTHGWGKSIFQSRDHWPKHLSPSDIEETYNILIQRMAMLIINFQNYLKMKNIPYLFFNAFDNVELDLKTSTLFKYIDLNNFYNNNLISHFKNYIEDNYDTDWSQNDDYFIANHPTDKSHILWGNQLYKYMVDNIL